MRHAVSHWVQLRYSRRLIQPGFPELIDHLLILILVVPFRISSFNRLWGIQFVLVPVFIQTGREQVLADVGPDISGRYITLNTYS